MLSIRDTRTVSQLGFQNCFRFSLSYINILPLPGTCIIWWYDYYNKAEITSFSISVSFAKRNSSSTFHLIRVETREQSMKVDSNFLYRTHTCWLYSSPVSYWGQFATKIWSSSHSGESLLDIALHFTSSWIFVSICFLV